MATELPGTQTIRLLDVFVIGPVMIKASTCKEMPVWMQTFLAFTGYSTIVFNGINYLRNR